MKRNGHTTQFAPANPFAIDIFCDNVAIHCFQRPGRSHVYTLAIA
jgi:hypothetical protein